MSSVQQLMSVPVQDRRLEWLKESLQCAITLEHSTLPPYLCALWSIIDGGHEAVNIVAGIAMQEMLHMGLACNLLAAIGGSPKVRASAIVPKYPGPLPCDIRPLINPDLKVGLSRLTPAVVTDVFMAIEYPEHGPVALAAAPRTFHTIGEFYGAIRQVFEALHPPLSTHRQLQHDITLNSTLFIVSTLADVLKAIDQIVEQGEGTPHAPDAEQFGHELAHYYKFKQLHVGRLYQQNAAGMWELNGPALTFPDVYPMADVPPGGFTGPGVPAEVGQFNAKYAEMLDGLQSAWNKGGPSGQSDLELAIATMSELGDLAQTLMRDRPISGGHGLTYGPTFRV